MICYVDMEHPKVLVDPERRLDHLGTLGDRKLRFEEITGLPCLNLHYTQVSRRSLKDLGVRAVLLSGCGTPWADYAEESFAGLKEVVESAEIPIIGFCGGHQFIGRHYGAILESMGPLSPGEPDPHPERAPGRRKEVGFMEVEILEEDPLFAGLGRAPVMMESHHWHLREVPRGWRLLAARPTCRVQAMRHPELPLYGTQFHPEMYDEQHPEGRVLLANFFRIAGIVAPAEDLQRMSAWRELDRGKRQLIT